MNHDSYITNNMIFLIGSREGKQRNIQLPFSVFIYFFLLLIRFENRFRRASTCNTAVSSRRRRSLEYSLISRQKRISESDFCCTLADTDVCGTLHYIQIHGYYPYYCTTTTVLLHGVMYEKVIDLPRTTASTRDSLHKPYTVNAVMPNTIRFEGFQRGIRRRRRRRRQDNFTLIHFYD